ncbi:hypothetical protein EIP91_003602 [Steccherinum ochraceum]|uniref:Enoyl reductase (ER) domain-containing protein n=1 Tax=Steccherinum ochraceum TaxID=92696 RepID=A0A4R0RA98_9APHY|nr:hypothetical protein EIP91_003602 [Steccherinum ochraceum]
MSPPTHVQEVVFAARPVGALVASEVFRLETVPYHLQVGEGEALVQTLYLSIDAGFRAFLDEGTQLTIPLGEVMRGSGVGVVREVGTGSKVAVGDYVYYRPGWRDWGVYKVDTLKVLLLPIGVQLVDYVGALGSSGLSAYIGLTVIGKIKRGETLVVSSAAGAVGHLVCQMGKLLGARVIAIAGSPLKCEVLEREFGVDKALNYKAPTFYDDLKAIGGIDVYFDNVGGEMLDFVMTQMKQFGRIVACGTISRINGKEPPGLRNYMNLIVQSAKIEGFFLHHYAQFYPAALEQISSWLADGKLKRKLNILDGLDKAPQALEDMFTKGFVGKVCVRLAEVDD